MHIIIKRCYYTTTFSKTRYLYVNQTYHAYLPTCMICRSISASPSYLLKGGVVRVWGSCMVKSDINCDTAPILRFESCHLYRNSMIWLCYIHTDLLLFLEDFTSVNFCNTMTYNMLNTRSIQEHFYCLRFFVN